MVKGESVNEQPTVAQSLQRGLRWLAAATVVLFLVVCALGIAGYNELQQGQHDTEDLAVTTTGALCALRLDLQSRVDQAETFLKSHPNGFAGLSPEAIQQQVDGQKRTIATLSTLQCPPTEALGGTP